MVATTVIAVPLAASARWLTRANQAIQGIVGVITIGIGALTVYHIDLSVNFSIFQIEFPDTVGKFPAP